MFGKTVGVFFDLVGTFDPRVVATAAFKGTTFRYVPAVGSPEILIKDDDGLTTNWISAGGGGGGAYTASNLGAGLGVFAALVGNDFQFKSLVAGTGITISSTATEITITNTGGGAGSGDPNTLAYFDNAGALTDNVDARFDETLNSLSLLLSPGSVSVTGSNSIVHARGDSTGTILASGFGVAVRGNFTGTSVITASSAGAQISGFTNGGNMTASTGAGASVDGVSTTGAVMTASAAGAMVRGLASGSGVMLAQGAGSLALGATTSSAQISSTAFGSVASGGISDSAVIEATASGALAHGAGANLNSKIRAVNQGCHAHGVISNGGVIQATGLSSHAHGNADTYSISAIGRSSFVGGNALIGNLVATSEASFIYGDAISVSGNYAQGLGLGHINSSYATLMIGRYGISTGATAASWVSTDPVFIVGNGTGIGSEAVGYKIDKDGKITTTAAIRNAACKSINADYTLSARLDRVVYVDTSGVGANINVTFPAGEDGLEYWVKDSGGNATTRNIIFVPTGGDLVEASANITNDRGSRHFQYFSGTWYILNLP